MTGQCVRVSFIYIYIFIQVSAGIGSNAYLYYHVCNLYSYLITLNPWLPAWWASGFSGDHQQDHQCLWLLLCYSFILSAIACILLGMKLLLLLLLLIQFIQKMPGYLSSEYLRNASQFLLYTCKIEGLDIKACLGHVDFVRGHINFCGYVPGWASDFSVWTCTYFFSCIHKLYMACKNIGWGTLEFLLGT